MHITRFVVLFLAVAVSSVASLRGQDTDTPVFRSDTNAISFEFGASKKQGRGGHAEPWTTLTIDDMKVVIDGKAYAPTTMTQDKPGHFVLSLVIPERRLDSVSAGLPSEGRGGSGQRVQHPGGWIGPRTLLVSVPVGQLDGRTPSASLGECLIESD